MLYQPDVSDSAFLTTYHSLHIQYLQRSSWGWTVTVRNMYSWQLSTNKNLISATALCIPLDCIYIAKMIHGPSNVKLNFYNNFMCICTEQWIRRTGMFSVTGVLWTREFGAHVHKPLLEYTIAFHYKICSSLKLHVIIVVQVISKRQNNRNIILTAVMVCAM